MSIGEKGGVGSWRWRGGLTAALITPGGGFPRAGLFSLSELSLIELLQYCHAHLEPQLLRFCPADSPEI